MKNSHILLNLGCGSKTSKACINVDWSPYLMLKSKPLLKFIIAPFLGKERRSRLDALDHNILIHDLRRALPFCDDSVDVVYHSHVLEHIDHDKVEQFLAEIRRVLKPNGIHRICVPDLERLAREYIAHCEECGSRPYSIEKHDQYVAAILEQCVRKDAFGSSQRGPIMKYIENLILGDARARGETHQWMYDRYNIQMLLGKLGFLDITFQLWNESCIPDWKRVGLELDEIGREYKPGSLYVECRK